MKMKQRTAHILLWGCLMLGSLACTKDKSLPDTANPNEGCATFAIGTPQTRAQYDDTQYPWNRCAIRIYKHTLNAEGEPAKELIRRYNARSEMPASLWLLAGDYSIAVEAGSQAEASFDEATYKGEQEFRIEAGKPTSVKVECRIVNTIVKVIYDPTIAATFKETYRTTVAFDEATAANPATGKGPYLQFEKTKTGYFILPQTATTLYWNFYGKGEKNGEPLEVTKGSSKAISTEPGCCYELRLKYSKDLGGQLDFSLTLDQTLDEIDDPITFIPNPQIAGQGFDMAELQRFGTEPLAFSVNSIGDMALVRIETGGSTYEIPAETAPENNDGIAVEVADPTNMTVALGGKFFARFGGGNHVLTLTAIDEDGGEGTKTMTVRTQGALAPAADPWFDDRKWRAYVLRPATDVKMEYRRQGDTSWEAIAMEQTEDADTYSTPTPAALDATYEYRLVLDGTAIGNMRTAAYPSGPQIYNAGFETWSGSKPMLPYLTDNDRNDQWWDTGNHGSSKAQINVTTKENDPRPGSSGSSSARLKSQKASLFGIGRFAAGNIFVGKYLGTDGMDGVIGFGKPFDFTYRPKQLTFWYKGTIGTIDQRGDNAPAHIQKGDSDVSQVYICLCKMDGPHVVATKRPETFLNFAANSKTMSYCTALNGTASDNDRPDGKIIAWASWEPDNTTACPDWTKITLNLTYNEEYEGEKPNYLLLTASASKYGDYFTGSTSSEMYLDDIELVY